MFGVRIEQESGAGFDDAAKVVLLQRGGDLVELCVDSLVVRIECAVIERDRDALVANFGQQRDCVEQVVVGKAVGVVGEEHCGGPIPLGSRIEDWPRHR